MYGSLLIACHTCHACQCGLRANLLNAWQLLILMCQCAKKRAKCQRCANISTWRDNVRKVVPFQTVLLQNAKGNCHTLLLYEKFYILLDIIAIHTICICIVHKNYVVLHFYTSCRIEVCGIFVFWNCFILQLKNSIKKWSFRFGSKFIVERKFLLRIFQL